MVGESHVNDIDKEGLGKEGDSIAVIVRVGKKIRAVEEGIRTC